MKSQLLIFAMAIFCFSGCAFFKDRYAQKPDIDLENIYFKDAKVASATMVLVLNVRNPNKLDLNVDEISYEIQLNKREFAKSSSKPKVRIPAEGAGKIEIPMPIDYLRALGGVGRLVVGEDVSYVVNGTAKISGLSIPFTEKGDLNLQGIKKHH